VDLGTVDQVTDNGGDAARTQSLPTFLSGGGRMGAILRGHDWSGSSLGPPEAWPAWRCPSFAGRPSRVTSNRVPEGTLPP
jgi:hypothetical protein